MKLILIRHGESIDAVEKRFQRPTAPLSERGRWQADRLAECLATIPIDHLYCSSMERAAETAARLGQRLGHTRRVVDDLREMGTGDWAGTLHQDFFPQYRAVYDAFWTGGPPPPGFESLTDCQARVVAAIRAIVNKHGEDETLALVGHGTAFRLFLIHILRLTIANYRLLTGMENTAFSIVLKEPGFYRLAVLNNTSHLH